VTYQVSAGTALLKVIDWQETSQSAFVEHDTWKNGAYAHLARVYGKYHKYQFTCAEQDVDWANSAVPYLYGIQSAGSAILLQCNHPYRPLSASVVVAQCVLAPPFEAGKNIRRFTVDFRESDSSGGGGGGDPGVGGGGIGEYKYLILSDVAGTSATVYDQNGNVALALTATATAINWAFANLTVSRTWQERVVFVGNPGWINATLRIQAFTIFDLIGQLNLTAASNCDMIVNDADGSDFITIRGGIWDGNRLNQTAPCHGIHFSSASANNHFLKILHLGVRAINGTGLYLDHFNSSTVDDANSADCAQYGYYLYVTFDCELSNIQSDSCDYANMAMVSCGNNHLSNVYLGGAAGSAPSAYAANLYIESCQGDLFENLRVDYCAKNGVILDGSTGRHTAWESFVNTRISDAVGTDNTFYAIKIVSYCDHNDFSFQTQSNVTTGHKWNTVVSEPAAADNDYNVFYIQNAALYTTLSAINGAHSKVTQGWTP